MEGSVRLAALIFLLPCALFLLHCQKKEETPPPPKSAQAPVTQQPPPTSAPAPAATKTTDSQGSADCCEIAANPELKGRLGRLLINFPEGAKAGNTRIDVMKPGEQNSLAGGYGAHTFELLPGTYDVEVSKTRVAGVTIKSAHDTRMKVGVLNVHAGKDTRVDVLDKTSRQKLTGGYGDQQFGLPVGQVQVQVAGQAETVMIQDGRVTEF